ncbi:MAG: UPF0175 family protein [Acidobacteriota bacterium]
MKHAVIPYPDDLPELLDVEEPSFGDALAFLAAAKLFEIGRLTAEQAASLAQMNRPEFLAKLQNVDVAAINLLGEEMDHEILAARELAG